MTYLKNYFEKYYSELALLSILFLFFLELIADFVEAVYALCLLTLSLNENVLTVLFLFSPILLILFKNRGTSKALFLVLGELMITCRILEAFFVNLTQLKMIFAGLGVGCFLMLFPLLFFRLSNRNELEGSRNLGLGLSIALMLSILFRVFGNTIDISTHGLFQTIGWILAIIASFMLIGFYLRENDKKTSHQSDIAEVHTTLASWKQVVLVFGVLNLFLLLYFTFSSPAVISSWTGFSYIKITGIIITILFLVTFIILNRPDFLNKINPLIIWILNGIFFLSLVSTIILHQIPFLISTSDYPSFVPSTTLIHDLVLLVFILTIPILIIDFVLLSRQLIRNKPSLMKLSGSFTLASFFFLLMIFANIFTTVYDYIPEIGPFFRDKYWLVFMLVGLGILLPIFLVKKVDTIFDKPLLNLRIKMTSVLIGAIMFSSAIGLLITSPYPTTPESPASLKIMTYNIQQGYSENGIKNFDGQVEVLKQVDADIIGLQESDTARISGGNCDPVRYFANQMHLYSYYGPKTISGTFGIALLSKYPIKNARTFFMYSTGEQTACIEAQITVGIKNFNVFVTHLGNGGPIIQQEQILSEVIGKDNVILMGDFNFRPYTDQYNLTTTLFNDSWTLKWPGWVDDANYNASIKIDHIFVSIGIIILDTRIIESNNSDHPVVWAEIEI